MKTLRMYVEVNQLKERERCWITGFSLEKKKKWNPNVQHGFALEGEKRN